jgi:hypothetical protein
LPDLLLLETLLNQETIDYSFSTGIDPFRHFSQEYTMNRIELGLLCGLIYGILDIALMIPMKMEKEKKGQAMQGAFAHRFVIGFVICNAALPWSGWFNGLLLGLLMSLPEAIITKSWAPILGVGAIGGAVIGVIAA